MRIPGIKGLNDFAAPRFVETSGQGKIIQIINDVASRFMKTIQSLTQDPPPFDVFSVPSELWLNIFCFLNAEEVVGIARVCRLWNTIAFTSAYSISSPSWLKDIDAGVWEKHVDLKKYGLEISEVPCENRPALVKALKPLARKVENNKGITNMVIPKGLTLKKILQIATDKLVPIQFIGDKILILFGDSAVEQTCVLFFTNSIFENTRRYTLNYRKAVQITNIGKECGIAIQMHQVRDFVALLVLTYLNSPENARTLLYPSATYTQLIEEVNDWVVVGGFGPFGLHVHSSSYNSGTVGVGASGNSQDIEACNH